MLGKLCWEKVGKTGVQLSCFTNGISQILTPRTQKQQNAANIMWGTTDTVGIQAPVSL